MSEARDIAERWYPNIRLDSELNFEGRLKGKVFAKEMSKYIKEKFKWIKNLKI